MELGYHTDYTKPFDRNMAKQFHQHTFHCYDSPLNYLYPGQPMNRFFHYNRKNIVFGDLNDRDYTKTLYRRN